uniref:TGF-beta propeptide domain-containing protein n=1 Tax=Trichogramma kaykai TaxID=54128 RepID=A0ABD2WMH1_9HYME
MITRTVLVTMVLLGALEFPGESRASGQNPGATPRWLERSLATTRRVVALGMCNACRMHEEIRALSLEAIKEQILNKLGMKQAPNMTGRALPRIPPISKLMDMYGMQADQPLGHEPKITHHEEVDDSVAKTDVVIALAQPPASVSGAHCTTNAILALAYIYLCSLARIRNAPIAALETGQRTHMQCMLFAPDLPKYRYNNCHSLPCKAAAPPYRPPVESLSPKHSSYSSKSRNNSITHTNRTIALICNNVC